MPHHEWGDEWFEEFGASMNEAMDYIRDYVEHKTGYKVSMKEKYGTIRYEVVYNPNDFSEYDVDKQRIAYIALNSAVRKAAEIYPQIAEEILEDSDWFENCDTLEETDEE